DPRSHPDGRGCGLASAGVPDCPSAESAVWELGHGMAWHGPGPGPRVLLRYVTGWSSGGGSVEPSRRMTGPTGAAGVVGGGGAGWMLGVGLGGVGWVMAAPNAGGAWTDGLGVIKSARLGASSRRGTPTGGSPSRS